VQAGIPAGLRNVVSETQKAVLTGDDGDVTVEWLGTRDGFVVDGVTVLEVVPTGSTGEWRVRLEVDVVLAHEEPPENWDILYRTLQMTEPVVEMWPFLTFQELEEWLGMSHQTIYKLMREGLPSHKVGKRRIFFKDEVEQWLRSRQP
jgi:excisionase family DNA binding protein